MALDRRPLRWSPVSLPATELEPVAPPTARYWPALDGVRAVAVWVQWIVATAVSLALAIASWHVVERPQLGRKPRQPIGTA